MKNNFKFTKIFYIFILIFSLVISVTPKISFAKDAVEILYNNMDSDGTINIAYEDGAELRLTPLSQDEINDLLENEDMSNNARFENVITCGPVKSYTQKDGVGVRFHNEGVILDRVDYAWTNLLVWQFSDDGKVLGFKAEVWHLGPYATSEYITVLQWYKAQTIGGEAIDGFGKEHYIGGKSSFLYNVY